YAAAVLQSQSLGIVEDGAGLDVSDLAVLARLDESVGESVNNLLLASPERADVDLRRREVNAPALGFTGVGDELGGVQQGLRGDAADVQAGAARLGGCVDQRNLQTAVGGEERGGVAPRASAQDDELRFNDFGHRQYPYYCPGWPWDRFPTCRKDRRLET